MRDLQSVACECMDMLDNIGIKYGNIKEIVPNTRARKRWGCCRTTKGGYNIDINADLLDERNPVDALKNTLIHEMLHTVKGCMNHGEKWKRQAEKVYDAYGINIKRTSDAEEEAQIVYTRPITGTHYTIVCQKCGHEFIRYRKCRLVNHPELWKCGCGGKLKLVNK